MISVMCQNAKRWCAKSPMNCKPKAPSIPIDGVMSYADWLKGRRWRRELSRRVEPKGLRRKTSSSDRRLRKLFRGRRGLPFTPTERL